VSTPVHRSLSAVVLKLRAARGRAGAQGNGGSGAPSGGRSLSVTTAFASLVAALISTLALGAGAASADSCPNAQFRTGPSASLPDCRAYEQVSPANKGNNEPLVISPLGDALGHIRASLDGNALSWRALQVMPGSQSRGTDYLSARGASAWSTKNLIPPQGIDPGFFCPNASGQIDQSSADLSRAVLSEVPQSEVCGTDDPPLVPGEPQGVANLFLRDNLTNSYQLISLNPVAGSPGDASLVAGTSDLSHVVFQEPAQLTADAPAAGAKQPLVYDWSHGHLSLVTVVGGQWVPGIIAGNRPENGGSPIQADLHAISADGSKIFFQTFVQGIARPPVVNLYLRKNDATTVQVDAPAPGAPGPGGHGLFRYATPDGSHVFFTDDAANGLTSDTVPGSGENLYRFDTATGALTDLTAASDAEVQGLSGATDDGSYVYFVADGVLAGGATAGQPNLYLLHAGTTRFIATLDPGSAALPLDSYDWNVITGTITQGFLSVLTARVSPDGRYLAFNSDLSLTGIPTAGLSQIYLYDANSGSLVCASCAPDGSAPTEAVYIKIPMQFGDSHGYLQRYLSVAPDGTARVFFDTTQALLPQDTNGARDVYEYEGGQLHLLSSGTSASDSLFFDASPTGNDLFFATTERLVPFDIDDAYDVYDARVGGGFPYNPPVSCTGDACKGAPGAAPPPPTAASVDFSGPGNASTAAPPGRARVVTRTVHGSSFLVSVRTSSGGRITITGAGVRQASRSAATAGTYLLKLSLTRGERAALHRKRTLRLRLSVRFAPLDGQPSVATVTLTVKA
jgi:WD40-like Beta Propeller Repeat